MTKRTPQVRPRRRVIPAQQHPHKMGEVFLLAPGQQIYIGPGRDGNRGPVLAIVEAGTRKPTVVAEFKNATSADRVTEILKAHVNALQGNVEDISKNGDQNGPSTVLKGNDA